MTSSKKIMSKFDAVVLTFAALLFVLFISYFIYFSTGIPKGDDFPMMLLFLDNWAGAKSFGEKFSLLTEQFLEHRMVAMKLTVLAIKSIFGKMDINAVNTVGIGLWFGTIGILFKVFSHAKRPLYFFLPILLITLHPGYGFEGMFWAATWMAFPWSIFLFLSFLYILVFYNSSVSLLIAWMLASFSLFSHGNGIITFFIGLLILVIQKKWKQSIVWTIGSSIGLLLFFFNYHYIKEDYGAHSPFENLIQHPVYIIGSIGAFIGSFSYFPDYENTYVMAENIGAIVSGLVMGTFMGVFIFLTFRNTYQKKSVVREENTSRPILFLCATGLFILITATIMSTVRGNSDIIHGFALRYKFYSILAVSVTYLTTVIAFPNLSKNSWFQVIVGVFCFFYCIVSYWYQTAPLANHRRIYQSGLYNSKRSKMWVIYQDARFWERGIDQYSNEKLWPNGTSNYKFPPVALNPETLTKVEQNLDEISNNNFAEIIDGQDSIRIHVKGPLFQIPMLGNVNNGVYLQLSSKTKSFLYPVYQEREGLRQFLRNRAYYKPEGRLTVKKKWFAPGVYKISLFVVCNSKKLLLHSTHLVSIKKYPFEV